MKGRADRSSGAPSKGNSAVARRTHIARERAPMRTSQSAKPSSVAQHRATPLPATPEPHTESEHGDVQRHDQQQDDGFAAHAANLASARARAPD
jgi:hypothetical protein